ncbi:MAG TPA: Gfo/Idh/MocA family oxidoreductase, partial [Thermomicrobiales bacterium]|nr:Gfo/Idh/MocA family oxidoreductase [Thermomicrobiales bacterium]
MSAKQSVNVGIVGLGRFGKLHARILTTLAGVNVVAATDPSPEAQAWAREVGIDTVYDTFAEILKHPDLDALFLISPEDLHAEQAMAVLDLGIPVFLEKPLSTTIEGAQAI